MKTIEVTKYLANENDQHDEQGRFAPKGDIRPPKIIEHKEPVSKLDQIFSKKAVEDDPDHVTVEERQRYEEGKMSHGEAVAMFQRMNNTGEVYHLQPHYGKTAKALIKAGYVHDLPPTEKLKRFGKSVVDDIPQNVTYSALEYSALLAAGATAGAIGTVVMGRKKNDSETPKTASNETIMTTEQVSGYLMANGAPLGNHNASGSHGGGEHTGILDRIRKGVSVIGEKGADLMNRMTGRPTLTRAGATAERMSETAKASGTTAAHASAAMAHREAAVGDNADYHNSRAAEHDAVLTSRGVLPTGQDAGRKAGDTAHHPVREADRQARREQDDSRGSAANPKPAANEKPTMKAENVYAYLMANAFNPDQPREQDGKFAGLDSPLKASYRAEFGTKTQAQKAADTFGTKTEQQRMADDFGTKSEKERYADTFGTKTEQEKYAAYATPKSEDPDHVDVGEMMDYENGSMPNDKAVNMFQRLHNSGMAYQLQGHYGRTAQSLLKAGYIHDKVPELAAAVGVLGGAAALAGKLGKPKAE